MKTDILESALLNLDIFAGCIKSGTIPAKGSPCELNVRAIIDRIKSEVEEPETLKPEAMTYRTFKDAWGFIWRCDGVNIETRPADTPSGWELSICTLEDLIEDPNTTETTLKP